MVSKSGCYPNVFLNLLASIKLKKITLGMTFQNVAKKIPDHDTITIPFVKDYLAFSSPREEIYEEKK